MYKHIMSGNPNRFAELLNELENDGFAPVYFSVTTPYGETNFMALMYRPDEEPSAEEKERMTPYLVHAAALCQGSVEEFEAALQAYKRQHLAARTPMERLAATADNVLREEARQYGATK